MDLSQSIVPKSDQLNSDDLVSAPVIVTIKEVRAGNAEQPVEVHTEEFPGRPYKPSKSMRRVMVQAWGAEASNYTGRRLKLFRNPDIKFGGMVVGGIEIEAMSHIEKPLSVSLMVTRGKRKPFTVQPLKEAVPTTPGIPPEITANATKAKADGALDQYVTWLTCEGAPEHIINHARSI